jgi:hypothetical protein
MKAIVRDWLSANHALLQGSDENAVIDSGYGARVADTLAHRPSSACPPMNWQRA